MINSEFTANVNFSDATIFAREMGAFSNEEA
jgi:hypothetical protein